MAKIKRIEVSCEGATTLKRSELMEFQGDLKHATDERLAMLKGLLIEYGFNSPIQVWRRPGKDGREILDGHQRIKALDALAADGYEVPEDLPVDWIDAKTKRQAKEIVLSRIAQYGEVTPGGLYSFMADSGLDMDTMRQNYPIASVDYDRFEKEFLTTPEPREAVGAREVPQESYSNLTHICPKCGFRFGKGVSSDGKSQ